jgi:TRAP-type mannitol/chloroaromatic compound transport system substrate-binding protein
MSALNRNDARRRFLQHAGIATTGIVAAGGLSAAAGSESYNWKMVTTWPKNFPGLGTGANQLAATIGQMSGGQLRIRVYGAGELVPALGVFDAVSRGTAEMGHSASYYWKGKHEATQLFAAVPFGLNAMEMNAWLHFGGAQELWDALYRDFNLKGFAAGNTGVQMGGWFNREINEIGDFSGLKIRMPGLGGEVLRSLGATVQLLPGGEIFQALKTGVIDATEWVGPYNDLAFGFQQAAKYYYWPGWHEPGTTIEAMVNKEAFEDLPGHLQAVVERGCQAANEQMLAEFTARNSAALNTLVSKHKVQLRRFPDPVLKGLGSKAARVVEDIASSDPFSKQVYESFQKFRKESSGYTRITEQAYSHARALTFG